MPLRWLNAYAVMLPRLEAEEALQAAQIALLPYHKKPQTRTDLLKQWQAQARGAIRPRRRTDYDEYGRLKITSGQGLRDWLNSHFIDAGLAPVTG